MTYDMTASVTAHGIGKAESCEWRPGKGGRDLDWDWDWDMHLGVEEFDFRFVG